MTELRLPDVTPSYRMARDCGEKKGT